MEKPSDSDKRGMKAFNESREKQFARAGLILLLTEMWPRVAEPDERNQTGILTSNSSLAPAFPACGQWHWEFVVLYSGVTVLDSHEVPRRVIAKRTFKERAESKRTKIVSAI